MALRAFEQGVKGNYMNYPTKSELKKLSTVSTGRPILIYIDLNLAGSPSY